VIPHLYEELGPDFARELDGMFAIALWDRRRRRMVLARDRFGEKPLYLVERDRDAFFASDMRAFVASGLTDRRISPQAVDDYLSLRYIPGPTTVYHDAREVPAGSVVCIDAEGVTHRRYWRAAFQPGSRMDLETAASAFRQALTTGVARAFQGEREAGMLLSGGLDSSSVAAAALSAGWRPPTYTVRYLDHDDGEGAHAAQVAAWLGVPNRPVWLHAAECARLLPEAVAALDQPNGDQSLIGLFAIARSASADGVVVLLGGDGADELLAGYRYYSRELWRRSAALSSTGVRRSLTEIPRSTRIVDHFRSMTQWDSAEMKSQVYSREMRDLVDPTHHLELITEAATPNPLTFLEQMLLIDVRMWLPGALLSKSDRMMMAFGVEHRSPYLTAPVVDLALSLPHDARLHRGSRKYVLKSAMRELLPEWVRYHPKRGFVPPTCAWLRAGPVHDLARDVLSSRALLQTGWFDADRLQRLLDDHGAGLHDHDDLLWALLILGIWLQGQC
jgi:asparagine synthase (glutamine-hydrolysing)